MQINYYYYYNMNTQELYAIFPIFQKHNSQVNRIKQDYSSKNKCPNSISTEIVTGLRLQRKFVFESCQIKSNQTLIQVIKPRSQPVAFTFSSN